MAESTQVSVVWEGWDGLIGMLQAFAKETPEKAKSIMSEIGEQSKEYMDEKTPVWKGKPDRSHQPGKLKEGNTLTEIEGGFELSNEVEYAQFVEFGTRKMAAEPFLEPTIQYASQEMDQRLPEALDID